MAKIMQAQITGKNYGFVFTDSEGQMHMGQKMFLTAPTNPADAIQATLLDGTVTMCDNGADVPVLAYALTSDFNANAHDTTNLTPAERMLSPTLLSSSHILTSLRLTSRNSRLRISWLLRLRSMTGPIQSSL